METQIERVGNVSPEANAEFMRLLENEDPKRYEILMRNIPRGERMTEDQALTNFMLGLPTGQWRFEVIAGKPAPTHITLPGQVEFNQKPFRPATADRGGRPRKFKSNAKRQKAFRGDFQHRKAELREVPPNAQMASGNHDDSTSYEWVL